MKAVVIVSGKTSGGLKIQEVAKPAPRANEVLIKVQAASVCRGDINLRRIPKLILVPLGLLFGFKPMKIPGVEYAGVVDTVSASVSRFKPGDAVFGTATGLAFGGNAEYLCVPEKRKLGVISLKEVQEELDTLASLAAAGQLKPLIDRSYALERTAEAHAYVEEKHKRGNVVIVVSQAKPD